MQILAADMQKIAGHANMIDVKKEVCYKVITTNDCTNKCERAEHLLCGR